MDKFQRPQKRPASIDGFVGGDGSRYTQRPDLSSLNQYSRQPLPSKPSEPSVPDAIDQFRRPEGFVAFDQPEIMRPGARNNPNELPTPFQREHSESVAQEPKLKKKRFGRKKKHLEAAHKKPTKLKIGLRVAGALGVLLLLTGAGLTLKAYLKSRNIFKGGGNSVVLNNENVDPTALKGEGDGRVNIMMLGKGGEEQEDGPDLTDTIMVASIDPIAKEAALLSVPRDLWVKSNGYESKINEVYANAKMAVLNNYSVKQRSTEEVKRQAEKAGIEAIKKVMSESLGIPLHYYVMIDFAGFRKAIDTVGGISINVKEELSDPSMAWLNKGNPVIAKTGQQTFDGYRALLYARSRKTSTRGDFSRAERQREVILALKEKVMSAGTFANPIKLNSLIDDFGDHIATDFSINEILRVYELMGQIESSKVASVGLDDYVMGSSINNLSAQIPKAGIFDFSAIQNYVRNIMKDAFLKSEDAKIAILNGTSTAGLATRKSVELKSFGYNVISVGDAPTKTYTTTTLVDLRNGDKKYTLNYLEKRLGVTAVTSLPDNNINAGTADFVIILGTDTQ